MTMKRTLALCLALAMALALTACGGAPASSAAPAAPASSGGILEKITSLFTGKKAEPKKEEDPFDGTALLGTLAGLMKQ